MKKETFNDLIALEFSMFALLENKEGVFDHKNIGSLLLLGRKFSRECLETFAIRQPESFVKFYDANVNHRLILCSALGTQDDRDWYSNYFSGIPITNPLFALYQETHPSDSAVLLANALCKTYIKLDNRDVIEWFKSYGGRHEIPQRILDILVTKFAEELHSGDTEQQIKVEYYLEELYFYDKKVANSLKQVRSKIKNDELEKLNSAEQIIAERVDRRWVEESTGNLFEATN
jgi:hypothetical protein